MPYGHKEEISMNKDIIKKYRCSTEAAVKLKINPITGGAAGKAIQKSVESSSVSADPPLVCALDHQMTITCY